MRLIWHHESEEYLADGGAVGNTSISICLDFTLDNATLDPRVIAERLGAELVE